MKQFISAILIMSLITSCNETGVSVKGQADSLGKELDTLGSKIEKKAEQVWDSTKVKAGEIKDKVEEKWDSSKTRKNSRDTVNKK